MMSKQPARVRVPINQAKAALSISTAAARPLKRCQIPRSPIIANPTTKYATLAPDNAASHHAITNVRKIVDVDIKALLKHNGVKGIEVENYLTKFKMKTKEFESTTVANITKALNETRLATKEPDKEVMTMTPKSKELFIDEKFFNVINKTKTAYGDRLLQSLSNQEGLNLEVCTEYHNCVERMVGNVTLINDLSDDLATIGHSPVTSRTDELSFEKFNRALRCLQVLDKTRASIEGYDDDCYDDFQRFLKPFKGEESLRRILEPYVNIHHISTAKGDQYVDVFKTDSTMYLEAFKKLNSLIPCVEKLSTRVRKVKRGKKDGYHVGSTVQQHLIDIVGLSSLEYQALERYIPSGVAPNRKLRLENLLLTALKPVIKMNQEAIKSFCSPILSKISSKIKISCPDTFKELFKTIGKLDVLTSYAMNASENYLSRPEFSQENELSVRHGVPLSNFTRDFNVRSNHYMFDANNRSVVINGPKGSGKTTYLKSIVQIIALAHMGSFVPSDYSKIGKIDKIIFLDEASFNLFRMDSVKDMAELKNVTENSLVIQDLNNPTRQVLKAAAETMDHLSRLKCRVFVATDQGARLQNYLKKVNPDLRPQFLKSATYKLSDKDREKIYYGYRFE